MTTQIKALCSRILLTSNEVLLKSSCLSNRLLAKSTSLPENISKVSSIWSHFRWCARQQNRLRFTYVHLWTKLQIHGTQNKCLQILFFNNLNKLFCDSLSFFILMCIPFPEPWAWIPVWGDLRLSAGSFSWTPAGNGALSENLLKECSKGSPKAFFFC